MKRNLLLIKLAGMAIIPLVLIILPATFFDKGQSVCLSVLLADTTCPGCGLTRAVQHFLHFDFAAAYHFNKMSVIIFPLLVCLWTKEFFTVLKKYKILKAEKDTL